MRAPSVAVCLLIAGAGALAGACGGGAKPAPAAPEPGGGDSQPTGGDGEMVSAETMDDIQRLLQRKGNAVSRCLAIAIDNKELPKTAKGRVTLEITITPSGAVGEVKVVKAALDSQSLHDCVISKVKEIQFPEVPRPYPTTYTYAFEAL